MFKTVLVGLISFFLISGLLIGIGHLFHIDMLTFTFYESSSSGFWAEGSVIPFIIGLISCYFIGNYYEKRKQGSAK
ncbi:hypothetical protein [Virgibacillus halodenitrificans]|uniref:hypothetical protein n=1 Tax=Virgibacillus halodenitrificans TaxID=1482 RepID=UPI00045CAE4A|nr:hypothetical protein [Virgibacillus halodenitrificans]CDQ32631.1 hypothetical protein BN993_02049 [Virgibacillus halodenitrificans]